MSHQCGHAVQVVTTKTRAWHEMPHPVRSGGRLPRLCIHCSLRSWVASKEAVLGDVAAQTGIAVEDLRDAAAKASLPDLLSPGAAARGAKRKHIINMMREKLFFVPPSLASADKSDGGAAWASLRGRLAKDDVDAMAPELRRAQVWAEKTAKEVVLRVFGRNMW